MFVDRDREIASMHESTFQYATSMYPESSKASGAGADVCSEVMLVIMPARRLTTLLADLTIPSCFRDSCPGFATSGSLL